MERKLITDQKGRKQDKATRTKEYTWKKKDGRNGKQTGILACL